MKVDRATGCRAGAEGRGGARLRPDPQPHWGRRSGHGRRGDGGGAALSRGHPVRRRGPAAQSGIARLQAGDVRRRARDRGGLDPDPTRRRSARFQGSGRAPPGADRRRGGERDRRADRLPVAAAADDPRAGLGGPRAGLGGGEHDAVAHLGGHARRRDRRAGGGRAARRRRHRPGGWHPAPQGPVARRSRRHRPHRGAARRSKVRGEVFASARSSRTRRCRERRSSARVHGARRRVRDRRLARDPRERHDRRQRDERLARDGHRRAAPVLRAPRRAPIRDGRAHGRRSTSCGPARARRRDGGELLVAIGLPAHPGDRVRVRAAGVPSPDGDRGRRRHRRGQIDGRSSTPVRDHRPRADDPRVAEAERALSGPTPEPTRRRRGGSRRRRLGADHRRPGSSDYRTATARSLLVGRSRRRSRGPAAPTSRSPRATRCTASRGPSENVVATLNVNGVTIPSRSTRTQPAERRARGDRVDRREGGMRRLGCGASCAARRQAGELVQLSWRSRPKGARSPR